MWQAACRRPPKRDGGAWCEVADGWKAVRCDPGTCSLLLLTWFRPRSGVAGESHTAHGSPGLSPGLQSPGLYRAVQGSAKSRAAGVTAHGSWELPPSKHKSRAPGATSSLWHRFLVGFFIDHVNGATIVEKRRKKGVEKKDFRGFNCVVLRGFTRSTPPTTPDRNVLNGSAPRGCSRVVLLSDESYVLFRVFFIILMQLKPAKRPSSNNNKGSLYMNQKLIALASKRGFKTHLSASLSPYHHSKRAAAPRSAECPRDRRASARSQPR